MKKFWKMTKNAADNTADILIYEQIGEDWFGEGITAQSFSEDLKVLGKVTQLNIHINSPGGSVFDGLAIHNMLRAHSAEKVVHIDGLAASIASVIAMAGDKIIMPGNSMLMIHDPFAVVQGDSGDMRKMAEALDKIKSGLVSAYMRKSNLSESEVGELMSDETWMNAQDAVDWGFADEVVDDVKMAAMSFDLSKFLNIPDSFKAKVPEQGSEAAINLLKAEAKELKEIADKLRREAKESKKLKAKTKTPLKEVIVMECKECGSDMIDDKCPNCEMIEAQAKATKDAKVSEQARIKSLRAMGKEFKGMENLVDLAIENDWSEQQLGKKILARVKENSTPGAELKWSVESMTNGKPFKNFGEQLIAIKNSAYDSGAPDKRLIEVRDAATGAGGAVPTDGGFLVQSDFTTELLTKTHDVEILAPKCMHIPVSGNGLEAPIVDETSRATGSRFGGVQIYRTNEAGTVTKSKPQLGSLSMKLEKLMGLFYATEELLIDAPALQAIVSTAFVEEFAFRVDDEIIRGTGAGQMLGLLNSGALIEVAKETGQLSDTIVSENIMNMYSRMPARLIGGSEWYINQECWPQLFELQMTLGTGGTPLFMPPQGLAVAPYGTLFGRPIQPIEQASALGDVGDILFANLNQYAIIEKGGLNAASSMHVQFLTDEQTFRWTMRNNGQPIWKDPLTPYKGSNDISPYIALAERA